MIDGASLLPKQASGLLMDAEQIALNSCSPFNIP